MPAQPKTTLEQLLHHLGFADAVVDEQHLEEGLLLDVKSEDAGRLIGRQGQTLSELQYILNRLLSHQDASAPEKFCGASTLQRFNDSTIQPCPGSHYSPSIPFKYAWTNSGKSLL